MTIRKRTSQLLQANRLGDPASRVIDILLVILILLSVTAVVLDTVESIRVQYGDLLWQFEIISVTIFSIEYILRFWSCPDRELGPYEDSLKGRLRWAMSPLGLIDLLAILPFYIAMFYTGAGEESLVFLRIIRGIRLLRIFKLTRYSPALAIMASVLKKESSTLAVAGVFLLVLVMISSWGIYILEKDVQPDSFGNIPEAMWWAIVSLTTVGYGDVVPMSMGGKFFAGIIALLGVGIVALPAGILASGFSSEMKRRENAYSRALEDVFADGIVTMDESAYLEKLRDELGLTEEEANAMLKNAEEDHLKTSLCPHCGKSF